MLIVSCLNPTDAAAIEEIKAADQGPQPECSAIAAGKREPKRFTGPFAPCASDGTRLTSGETVQHYLHKVKISKKKTQVVFIEFP